MVVSEHCDVACRHLVRLSDLLQNADVDVRICAGEAIALLYELARADEEVGTAQLLFKLQAHRLSSTVYSTILSHGSISDS